MPAGDQSTETFVSLYLSRKGRGGRPASRLPQQAPLFPPVLSEAALSLVPQSSSSQEPEDVVEPAPRLWTVRELVSEIRQQIERAHVSVWVEGEISNLRPAPSGHLYFTLKDGEAQLPVVLFRRQAILLAAPPKDGDAVEVRGRISIYESRGQLQLIAETLELRGAGALELAFKRLKARLLAEGLFDEDRKRPLPAYPRCIGVVTSPSGAVVRDIATVARRRHSCLNLLVYPAAMQGATCAAEVAAGVRWFNRHPDRVDLIVLARGGGSIEDLAGFNDEALARVIAASELPVVSAVGHETDFTIADFVADLRAPTPSAAAELVTAAQHRVEERVEELTQRVQRAGRYQVICARQRYTGLAASSSLMRLRDAVSRRDQRIDELRMRLHTAGHRRPRLQDQLLQALADRLRRHDPSQRLAAMRHRLATAADLLERLRLVATDSGSARLSALASRLHARSLFTASRGRLERAASRLDALSPLAVLNRGYALVYQEEGSLLRRAAEVSAGSRIRVRLAEGSLLAEIEEITP